MGGGWNPKTQASRSQWQPRDASGVRPESTGRPARAGAGRKPGCGSAGPLGLVPLEWECLPQTCACRPRAQAGDAGAAAAVHPAPSARRPRGRGHAGDAGRAGSRVPLPDLGRVPEPGRAAGHRVRPLLLPGEPLPSSALLLRGPGSSEGGHWPGTLRWGAGAPGVVGDRRLRGTWGSGTPVRGPA